ncbi:MAG: bifunctional folylpolyglutamate synthase/dihydrofolate synthase, partial [Oscillospiraceae bacterium]|nr:bifunctional folylpolyglutamate synthase/dihydrofolate synthase [Oscillospiraceae bacterium]
MTYEEALQFIHAVSWKGSVPGLERITELMARLGNPEKRLKFIHIVGTNGKGSTAAMLSSVLREAGYRTGLFISPYVIDFRERMQLDGEMISQEALAAETEAVRLQAEAMADPPTEFELITAIALKWFADQSADIVVLEAGMGGALDATNVIPAP